MVYVCFFARSDAVDQRTDAGLGGQLERTHRHSGRRRQRRAPVRAVQRRLHVGSHTGGLCDKRADHDRMENGHHGTKASRNNRAVSVQTIAVRARNYRLRNSFLTFIVLFLACFSDILTFKRHSVGLTTNLSGIRAINILIYKRKKKLS